MQRAGFIGRENEIRIMEQVMLRDDAQGYPQDRSMSTPCQNTLPLPECQSPSASSLVLQLTIAMAASIQIKNNL